MSLSPADPGHPGGELSAYTSLLRRRWLIFLFCVAAGFAGSAGLLRLTPPAYTATTQVLVSPTGLQDQVMPTGNRQREALNLDTEAQIAQSAVVATKAATILGSADPVPLEVSVPPNSSILSISAAAPTPGLAATRAAAFAQAYLGHRAEAATEAVNAQLKTLAAKLKQVNTDLGEVATTVTALERGTAEHTIAYQRQTVLSRQAYNLTARYDSLRTVAIDPGSVISEARPPKRPSAPSFPLYLGSGLMAGLVAGAGAAFARDRLDTRLRSAADVERLTRIPVHAELAFDRLGAPYDPARRKGSRSGTPLGALHELTAALLAARPGDHLLLRPVGATGDLRQLAAVLDAALAPVTLLTGEDLRDLARADSALLVVGTPGSAREVTAAARSLSRHGTRVVGAVVTRRRRSARRTEPVPDLLPPARPAVRGSAPVDTELGRLVASSDGPGWPAVPRSAAPVAGPRDETTPLRSAYQPEPRHPETRHPEPGHPEPWHPEQRRPERGTPERGTPDRRDRRAADLTTADLGTGRADLRGAPPGRSEPVGRPDVATVDLRVADRTPTDRVVYVERGAADRRAQDG
ncbi:hypothetical protein Misp01_24340 [Microtetraspora sp. NBRC 13810]|uniref:Wzz/FepE/Etk N-terminal domain-containing protein n=1 Tax=Microtetraspora sp. NBRC 13810 TaxID=3030990 RepID=UPI0024A58A9C|nr:Wzz/FepE/Etk N-terminal domain-containing protein [Microtetraspora sp. NBRC 13810]GLW07304.1 hypothetical protein Misp01_24340 [Microtetraspora sp. NBRC 13810]